MYVIGNLSGATDPEVRVHFRCYRIFWVVGLEWGPLKLVSTIHDILERSSGSGLENRNYDSWDPSRWSHDNFYRQKLALTLPTCCGRSAARSRTKATELVNGFRVATLQLNSKLLYGNSNLLNYLNYTNRKSTLCFCKENSTHYFVGPPQLMTGKSRYRKTLQK
jgi:hypothetical protein